MYNESVDSCLLTLLVVFAAALDGPGHMKHSRVFMLNLSGKHNHSFLSRML